MKQEIISQDPDLKVSVLKTSFVYRNQVIQAEWFDVDDKTVIPDLPWQQIYVIGDLDPQGGTMAADPLGQRLYDDGRILSLLSTQT